jgi:hypothetical protein
MSETVTVPTRLAEVLNDLFDLQELGPDWNLEGARPVDQQAIQLAAHLVRSTEESASQQAISWQPPEIGAVPDGSVALTWGGGGRQALIICRPGDTDTVECVTREDNAGPMRQMVSFLEAIRLSLWALGGK